MIHLHNHTTLGSLRDGFSKIPELVARVKELNMPSIAITEHGCMTSSIEFYNECKKNGINGIIGLEAYFVPELGIRDRNSMYHLVLLAQSLKGYQNLVKLNTESHKEFYYKPRTSLEMLKKYSEDIICLSGCMGSILNTDSAEYWAEKFREVFGNRFFIEIQSSSDPKQYEYNHKVLSIAKKLNIDYVCTADTHYVLKSDAHFHRLWVTNGKDSDYYPTDDLYIQTTDEAMKLLSYLPHDVAKHAIDNTYKISEMCHVELPGKADLMPKYECDNPVEELKKYCRIGWKQKISNKIPKSEWQPYIDRFNYELDALTKGGYVEYMLIINDILSWCRKNNIMHGFGRGSVGGSLISWLLNFGAVNPIESHLLFERFINPSRVTMADIDVDLQDDKRELVIDYLKTKYKYVLPIRTIGYVKDKSAVQIAGRLLGIPPAESIELSKNIEKIDDIQDKEKYAELIKLAHKFCGLVSSFGQHASGYIVTNSNPTDYFSIEYQKEYHVLNQEYHTAEKFGFLKLDLLSLSNLKIIQETLDQLETKPDLWNLPLDDVKVYEQYSSGFTQCIFQVESQLMQGYAKKLGVSCFDDVVALLSIGRPAVIQSGMADQYIQCKNSGEYKYLHPLLEPILKKSHSSLIFQEQVMQILQVMANMSLAEADNARRIMGRKIPEELDQIIPSFIEGCEKNNIPKDIADKITKWIIDSSSYLFNASHAANYSYLSYVTAWLRKYYPLEYMCAVLNNEVGNLEKTKEYFEVCKNLGVQVLPPDLRYSKPKYTIANGKIYYGLSAIKGIGKNLNISNVDSFESIVANNSKNVTEALIKSGSLDYLKKPRVTLLSSLESLQDIINRKQQCLEKIAENEQMLSQATTDKEKRKYERQLNSWKQKLDECLAREITNKTQEFDEVAAEVEVLGFSFKQIPKVKEGKLTNIFSKNDKNGKPMGWLTFDSNYGNFRCTVFANGWSKIADKVKQGETYKFVVSDQGILEEIAIDGQVYKTNERKWRK